ncbi:hypothetical protein [Haloarcula halophila]|uniref:hypothetical protein n=1 Tax=Haloarcula TaxID=2237 RepID=UPI0023E3F8CD|nr:hypothetical protein [Halomicroarcula sp. DFY41]
MTGFKPEDRVPMAAAIVVVVVSNVVGYALGVTIYMSILATPLALVAFGLVRYVLHGSAVPDALVRN